MNILKASSLSRLDFGKSAENKAKRYLKRKGYQFIKANYHTRDGEIDLIFKDGDTFVFVEVRAKRDTTFGQPEDTITPKKMTRCKKAAVKYLYDNKLMDSSCRFDVIALVNENNKWNLRHYENAFE